MRTAQNLQYKLEKRLESLKQDSELVIKRKGIHWGLYADEKWVMWLNLAECQTLNEMGVEQIIG